MKRIAMTLLFAAALPVAAQQLNNTQKTLACDENRGDDNGRRQRACEIREHPGGGVSRITVDGRTNGGVNVKGWDRNDTLVRAKVETWAATVSEAKGLAGQVSVQTAGGVIQSDAPDFGKDRGWAVSYEIFVPHRTGLNLKAHNGGIKISDVIGDISFDALNGGVALIRLGGNVTGSTKNGGLKIELAGNHWDGNQLNVSTMNGGVSMDVPDNYSARLETGTVNGRVQLDFPVTVQPGKVDMNREVAVNLGNGGALLRVKTTNGGVSIRRKG